MTGCDTTSAFFKKGKKTALTILKNNNALSNDLSIFKSDFPNLSDLIKAGQNFILKWYGSHKSENLNELRYYKYCHTTARQNLFQNFELATLPPTSEAAELHIKRVYLQVQLWMGNELNPEDWGWIKKDGALQPQKNLKEIAPEFILKFLFCGCKSNCSSKSCTCSKFNLKCTASCSFCLGQYCSNVASDVSLVEDDEDF